MDVAVITTPSDQIGATSPLAALEDEGLTDALAHLGCHLRLMALPEADGDDAYAAAAAHGRRMAEEWGDGGPEIVLCDGYLSGLAGHAAVREGGRVVLWLGTIGLPTQEPWRRLATAVARSASAVFTSALEVALWVRHERLSNRVEVVQPAVHPAAISEHRPWPGQSTRKQGRSPVGPQDTKVAVVGHQDPPVTEPGAPPRQRSDDRPGGNSIVRLLRRATDRGTHIDITEVDDSDPARVLDQLGSADVVVTGLTTDGGRTTLRAMARGLAVVSLPRVPDRDLVVDRVSGITARDGKGLVAAVRELGSDPFLREALGQGAIDRVQVAHSAQIVAELLVRRLQEVLTEPADGRGQGIRMARQLGIDVSEL